MHLHDSFQQRLGLTTPDEVFDFFKCTLKKTRPTLPDYYVNWDKVLSNSARVEMALHQLDYIIGKPDMSEALAEVLQENPSVVEALPAIFASRDDEHLLIMEGEGPVEFIFQAEALRTDKDVLQIVRFCDEIGLFRFIRKARITNFVDFVYGVETGIDTNGRKNRGGKQMEASVEEYIAAICQENEYEYMTEATASHIKRRFKKELSVDKTNRRIDFVINTPDKLFLIETNYYAGGGSKLKATAGEYQTLHDAIAKDGHQFIWITDGAGWKTTLNALRETFDHVDYILNLEMLASGILSDLIGGQG